MKHASFEGYREIKHDIVEPFSSTRHTKPRECHSESRPTQIRALSECIQCLTTLLCEFGIELDYISCIEGSEMILDPPWNHLANNCFSRLFDALQRQV
jgi:hypothetical protein